MTHVQAKYFDQASQILRQILPGLFLEVLILGLEDYPHLLEEWTPALQDWEYDPIQLTSYALLSQ